MTLLSGAVWTINDDTGDGQSGTIGDAAWVAAFKASIETLIHSTTNPTVTPEDIIDEVVTARNGQASLNAYLATFITSGYLTGANDLGVNWEISSGRELRFSDPDVAHGMTGILETDQYAALAPRSATSGGVNLFGLSDLDDAGMRLYGVNGQNAAPTNAG